MKNTSCNPFERPLTKQQLATMRRIAINTNAIIIERKINEDPDLKPYRNELFVRRAAIYNYDAYGFGVACPYDYLDYLETLPAKKGDQARLYNTNVKEWYRIIKSVFARDSYTCAYCCQIGGKLECDHIIPLSKGGSNDFTNLTTSCQRCNRQKRDKSVEEFLAWRAAQP